MMRNMAFVKFMLLGAVALMWGCGDGTTAQTDDAAAESAPADNANTESAQTDGAEADGNDEAPAYVSIDDLDFLEPVDVEETAAGLVARPASGEGANRMVMALPPGADADGYRNFAQFIAGMGNLIHVVNHGQAAPAFEDGHGPDQCTLIGGIAEAAPEALEFAFANMGSVDGAIVVSTLMEEGRKYRKKLPLVVVAGGQDEVAPEAAVRAQYPQYPALTYFITINEANRRQYYDAPAPFDDGEALVPADQQRLILGEVVANMIDRLCLTRETRLAEEARKAALAARSHSPVTNDDQ